MGQDASKGAIRRLYEDKYKLLLFIPFILLMAAFIQIGVQTATTGDFLNKGVSLKGGISITISTGKTINAEALEQFLNQQYPEQDIAVHTLSQTGRVAGIVVESDIDVTDAAKIEQFKQTLGAAIQLPLTQGNHSIESIGSSLGQAFFVQTFFALLLAFLFMGVVVFFYFRTIVPSIAVILAALSDIVVTMAIFNLIGIKLSSAGVAAFLMLIGYSVDTDILLSTRVLKRSEGTVMSRVYSSMKTGMMMSVTTLVALVAGLLFTQSEVIKQIMLILVIGLLVDLVNTWIQNVGIIRLYLEKKKA